MAWSFCCAAYDPFLNGRIESLLSEGCGIHSRKQLSDAVQLEADNGGSVLGEEASIAVRSQHLMPTRHPSPALSALARGDLAFFADYFQQRGQRGKHYRPSDDSDGAEGFQ